MTEFNNTSLFTSAAGFQEKQLETLYAGDIRRPEQSVYGFPMAAARLAAHRPLLMHGREDEIFALLAALNGLLGRPEPLNRAYARLKRLQTESREELVRRLALDQEPISDGERRQLIEAVEQALAHPAIQTTATRLEALLRPSTAGQEAAGLKRMVARLQLLVPALAAVKDQGFQVVVAEKRRQPARPALEARRTEPVRLDEQPTAVPAGFLLPPQYHLTLWAYRIVRSDHGQSAVWN